MTTLNYILEQSTEDKLVEPCERSVSRYLQILGRPVPVACTDDKYYLLRQYMIARSAQGLEMRLCIWVTAGPGQL